MTDKHFDLVDQIKKYASKFGCHGPISELVPNPCILNPWSEEDHKRDWTVMRYPNYALVVFHEDDRCFRVERNEIPLLGRGPADLDLGDYDEQGSISQELWHKIKSRTSSFHVKGKINFISTPLTENCPFANKKWFKFNDR